MTRATPLLARRLAAALAIVALPIVADIAHAQSAPPLSDVQIVAVSSATQAERITPGQAETKRRHTGPITVVVQESGIGRARVLRVGGNPTAAHNTSRPLCGPAVTAGACRPGVTMAGVEITYHLGPLPAGTTVSFQDTSANLPMQTLTAEITIN